METDLPVFPEIEPYHSGFLKVSDRHDLYYEEVGNPQGRPVVFLHGGPGGGCNPLARRFYDPAFYRIILFDQRGAGQSTPHAALEENTTWDLVADIERLRAMLGIERWLVFGGSWGSTLALAFAIRHPQPVVGLVLRGIFLCRKWEIDWLYQEGASRIFADGWDEFIAPIPPEERGDMLSAYYRATSPTRPRSRKMKTRKKHWRSRASKPIISSTTASCHPILTCWMKPLPSMGFLSGSSRAATIWFAP
jgi:proline iminopeptidase